MIMTFVLVLAALTALWVQMSPRPQPARARRNPLQEDLLTAYLSRSER